MITSNLSPTGQLGFKQPTYILPRSQGANIGCSPLSLIDSDVELNFVRDYLFVKATCQILREPPELGTLTPCEPINIENVYDDTNQKLYHIISGKKGLSLMKPIEYTIDFRDGIWTMENKDLGIISISNGYKECFSDFNDEVFFIYEEYGQEEDDKLTKDAKELKRKILQHIAE